MKKKLLFIIFIVFTLSDTLIAQDWQIGGSALTTTGKLGSTTKQNVQLITNNAVRLTLTSAGIFKINSDQSSIQFSNAGANPKPMMFI